jgi:hypothetical protein
MTTPTTKVADPSRSVAVVDDVMTNNDQDQGQRNAKTLSKLLNSAETRK